MAIPVTITETCPRCLTSRIFVNVDGTNATYRCSGCEWQFSLTTQSPTDTTNAIITAGVSTAISVAAGGASFTSGMLIVIADPGNVEVVVAGSGATGTSIPVPGGFIKTHASGVSIGQMLLTPLQTAVDIVPALSPYPTSQPATF